MSGKRAKRLRAVQRANGIEPRLDAKRRTQQEEIAALEAHRNAVETLRREHPEEYAARQREFRRTLEQRFSGLVGVVAAIGM